MTLFDLVVAAILSLVVFFSGVALARSGGKDTQSFVAASGAVPWWISGLSLFMSFFSVGTFVVWGSIAFSSGLVAVSIQAMMCLAGVAVAVLIAPKWNQTSVLTAAEYIGERFGENTKRFYTGLFLAISIFTVGAFLYPVGKILEIATGAPLDIAIIGVGLAVLTYTAMGGLWSVLVTDVLQFVILSVAVLITVVIMFTGANSLSDFTQNAPQGFFDLSDETYTPLFLIAYSLYNAVYIGGNWAYVQRYTSVRSPSDAKKVGWTFAALYFIAPIIWMLPAMAYRTMVSDPGAINAEDAYLLATQAVLPSGLFGLVVAGMVFASASSINTTLNISSSVFAKDLYSAWRPNVTDAEGLLVARIMTIMFGLITIFVALSVKGAGGIVEVVLSVAALTGVPIFLPPIWAMFSRYLSSFSILFTSLASLGVTLLLKFVAPVAANLELSRSHEMLVGVLLPVALLAGFEAYGRATGRVAETFRNYEQRRARRFERKLDEAEFSAASGENHDALTVIGAGIFVVGALLLIIAFNASENVRLVACAGAFLVIIASLFVRNTWRKFRENKQKEYSVDP